LRIKIPATVEQWRINPYISFDSCDDNDIKVKQMALIMAMGLVSLLLLLIYFFFFPSGSDIFHDYHHNKSISIIFFEMD
jgi:hypothetical protein